VNDRFETSDRQHWRDAAIDVMRIIDSAEPGINTTSPFAILATMRQFPFTRSTVLYPSLDLLNFTLDRLAEQGLIVVAGTFPIRPSLAVWSCYYRRGSLLDQLARAGQ